MRTAIRASNLFLTALLALALVPAAFAQRHGAGHPNRAMHPAAEATPRHNEVDPRLDRVEPEAVRRVEAVPGRVVAPRAEVQRRGCVYQRGRVGVAGCNYYYDDKGDYYDAEGQSMPGWSPDQPLPSDSNASPGAAKLAPAPGADDDLESFNPEGNDALRDQLVAGRKNWMQKKAILDDINAAVARAEYQKYQTGRPVDPRLVAEQQVARNEAKAAHDALTPLVEQAREAGMSARVLELYNEMNQAD